MSGETQVKKILILTANPKGTDKLRLDEEARDMKEGLRRAKERDCFEIQSEWAVRPRDIRRAILDFKPHIVHFSGHGVAASGLAFENELGQVHLVTSEALAGLFKLLVDHVECVFLNACYSEIQAAAISQHINFVVGMNQAIGDKAAIEFSIGFYDALMAGCCVETAYEFGCNAIQLAGLPEHLTPVLKQRRSAQLSEDSGAEVLRSKTPYKDSITQSLTLKEKIRYTFVLSGNVDEVDKETLETIVDHLRKITGDISLTLKEIQPGSIKLILEGSEEGFRLLAALLESGQLNQALGVPVEEISKEGEQLSQQTLDEQLNQLLQSVREYPRKSLQQNLYLERIIRLLSQSRLLWRGNVSQDVYEDILQNTWIYLVQNLWGTRTGSAYDPGRGSILTWVNAFIKGQMVKDEYQIQSLTKSLPLESLSNDALIFQASSKQNDAEEQFLQIYRTQFVKSLDVAIEQVVQDRITQFKTENQTTQFLAALHLFYCRQSSMTEIARELGLHQHSVARLLNLKALQADVRLHTLTLLKLIVTEVAQEHITSERLQSLDQALDTAISEQLQAASYPQRSLFADRLCFYLDQLLS